MLQQLYHRILPPLLVGGLCTQKPSNAKLKKTLQLGWEMENMEMMKNRKTWVVDQSWHLCRPSWQRTCVLWAIHLFGDCVVCPRKWWDGQYCRSQGLNGDGGDWWFIAAHMVMFPPCWPWLQQWHAGLWRSFPVVTFLRGWNPLYQYIWIHGELQLPLVQ